VILNGRPWSARAAASAFASLTPMLTTNRPGEFEVMMMMMMMMRVMMMMMMMRMRMMMMSMRNITTRTDDRRR
jgi:hypothetical protein